MPSISVTDGENSYIKWLMIDISAWPNLRKRKSKAVHWEINHLGHRICDNNSRNVVTYSQVELQDNLGSNHLNVCSICKWNRNICNLATSNNIRITNSYWIALDTGYTNGDNNRSMSAGRHVHVDMKNRSNPDWWNVFNFNDNWKAFELHDRLSPRFSMVGFQRKLHWIVSRAMAPRLLGTSNTQNIPMAIVLHFSIRFLEA